MNISYVNINVVGKILFIGVKNEQIQKTVDETLQRLIHRGTVLSNTKETTPRWKMKKRRKKYIIFLR